LKNEVFCIIVSEKEDFMITQFSHLFNYSLACDLMAYIIEKHKEKMGKPIDFSKLMRLLIKFDTQSLLSGNGVLLHETYMFIPELGLFPINSQQVASNLIRAGKLAWRFNNQDFPRTIDCHYVGNPDTRFEYLSPFVTSMVDSYFSSEKLNALDNWSLLVELNQGFNSSKTVTHISYEDFIRAKAPVFIQEELVEGYIEQKKSREMNLLSHADYYH
jgi:hypothetical protein